jgi:hypothetical protein
MEVVNKSSMGNTQFGKLEIGQVFQYKDKYYMKIMNSTCSPDNAVSLTDGELCVMHKANPVFKVNARCEVTYVNE